MNQKLSSPPVGLDRPTQVRYGVLGFACVLSMITYLDRVCFGTVAPYIQREFGLDDFQKGLLFSAFALAYAVFEVPTGWLGDVFGPRKTLIRIVLWWSVFTALTGSIYPGLFGFAGMLLVRFFFGVGEAGAYPNIARAFHNWFPFRERGFAQGTVWMAGRFAGGITPLIVLALFYSTPKVPAPQEVTGTVGSAAGPQGLWLAAAHAFDLATEVVHWRHTFWIFGVLGVAWCLLFWWWFRDRPEQKQSVNSAELALIHGEEGPPEPAHANVPWLRLLGNLNLWTLCGMYFFAAYGWYFNITYLPGYLESHFGLTPGVKWSGQFWMFTLLAGAPLLLGSLACLVGGMLTDGFIRATGNRKWGRRLFGLIGHSICALCYILSGYATDAGLFVLAVALAAFWNDLTMGSAWASCLDIGGKYSGIVAGCMNTIGNLGGAMAGVLTGWILAEYKADIDTGWHLNFLLFGAVYIAATLLWLRFDSTQPVSPDAVTTAPRPAAGQVSDLAVEPPPLDP
jgi:MFS family permease